MLKPTQIMNEEKTHVVFDITTEPEIITETLDAYAEEGWKCANILTVANTNIVAFLKRNKSEPLNNMAY